MNDNASLVGKEISGCEILSKTAEGGMGAVYRARHKALNRIVCVKILSPSLANDKKAVELFLTEARAIAELDHPNIVNVYNVGKEKGYYFIVMSFIEGQTLSMMLKKNKILPIGVVLDLFDGVLQGLAAAHEKGIIHRDIKPSNILINPQGQAKVVDFGIAKKVDKEKGSTKTTELAGTAYFIAPEQALGKDLDTRADLYSIGASLYYVLTGQFPYNGKNTIEIIQKHINDPVPDPAKIRKDMPGWLSLAIQKLMSKNPDERFQTAKDTYLYFRKMRAEDQLRVKTGNSGRSVDLGEEGPLKIVKDEKFSTDSIKKIRAQEISSRRPTTSSAHLPLMPQMDTIPSDSAPAARPAVKAPSVRFPNAKAVRPLDMLKNRGTLSDMQEETRHNNLMRTLMRLAVFVPLFMVFAGAVSYLFYLLGKISSVHISVHAGLLHNLIGPLLAPHYEPNQLLFTGLCAGMLALIFASSALKAFSRSTTTLLVLALVSYLSGLFTPNVPFMELSNVGRFIFTPEYYLCYLVFAVAWTLALCWTMNRTICQGILAAALTLLSMTLAYLSSHMAIPPDAQNLFIKLIFYASLLCALLTVYYFLSRSEKDTLLAPFVFLLLGLAGLWCYSVSGMAGSMTRTLETLVAKVEVKSSSTAESNARVENLVQLKTNRQSFAQFDHTNELTGMSEEEGTAFLERQVDRFAAGEFDEKTKPIFLNMLLRHYQGGASKMKLAVWDYAISFPVKNFNENAQKNNAYFFLLALLYIFGTAGCAANIFFGDEL